MNAPFRHPGTRGIPVSWRKHPLAGVGYIRVVREGMTIAQIVNVLLPELPVGFFHHGVVRINNIKVPRDLWEKVRPRVRYDFEVIVSMHVELQGGGAAGGGGGQKNTLATVASIAVLLAAAAVSGGALGIGALIAEGGALGIAGLGIGTANALAGAATGIIGSLAISALTPPPSLGAGKQKDPEAAKQSSLDGNVLSAGGAIPRVVGKRRVFPPFASQPLVEIVGDDEVIEATYILAGRHSLEEIRIGEADIADVDGMSYETRNGHSTDTAAALVTRYARTASIGRSMDKFKFRTNSTDDLEDQDDGLSNIPGSVKTATAARWDEYWLTVRMPTGLQHSSANNTPVSVPWRLKIRKRGTEQWIRLPEIHLSHTKNEDFGKHIKIKRATWPGYTSPRNERTFTNAFGCVPMFVHDNQPAPGGFSGVNLFNNGIRETIATVSTQPQAYVGVNWAYQDTADTQANERRTLNRIELWSRTSGNTFGNQNDMTFTLYYKDSTPASDTDGTILATQSITDGTTRTSPIVFIFEDMSPLYMWVRITRTSGGNMNYFLGETRVYGDDRLCWRCHDSFLIAADQFDNYANSAIAASTNLQNLALDYEGATFYLDPAVFPDGIYDVEVRIGSAYKNSNFTAAEYSGASLVGGNDRVADFFGYIHDGNFLSTPWDQEEFAFQAVLARGASVVNSLPVVTGCGLAWIAIKGTGNVEQLSVEAAGLVNRWSGGGWDDLGASSNPADHYYDILAGPLNARPLPAALIDEDSLVDWRILCDDKNYQVNAVIEDKSAFECLGLIAACGYARPWQSEMWGVTIDRDRTHDIIRQTFSERNIKSFTREKTFGRLPSGLRVRFDDKYANYDEREVIVLGDDEQDDGVYEDVRYDGFISEDEAVKRARFDLKQASLRSILYTAEVSLEHIVVARGDLVALSTDVIDLAHGFSRIKKVVTSGGNITGLKLFGTIQVDPSLSSRFGLAIRCLDGTEIIKEIVVPSAVDDLDEVVFSVPFANPGTSVIDEDCLIVSGRLGNEYKRVIVSDVIPKEDFNAVITFRDEAPLLFAA